MAPFLLLGFVIAGILHVYIPEGAFTKWFGKKNFKSVLYASLMGIPLPLCSCGVIPTGISLHKEGASKGATVSFLISTPQTGVDSIMVTYSLLGLPFAIARPIIALITGVAGGWAVNQTEKEDEVKMRHSMTHDMKDHVKSGKSSLVRIWNYAFDEFLGDISDWLIIGLLLAGLIAVAIPDDFFSGSIAGNEFVSMLIVLAASIPFYVCATGSVPIAAVLLMKGLNPGAVLVFLMAGPATNVATMTVISRSLGRHTLVKYIGALVLGSLFFGLLINHLLPREFFSVNQVGPIHDHGGFWPWIESLSALFLAAVLLKHYVSRVMNFFRKRKGSQMTSSQEMDIEVIGMTCENCASRVESSLLSLDSVNESKADLPSGIVKIKGNDINVEELKASIEGAGYHLKQVLE